MIEANVSRETSDERDEAIYRWTIRSLYAVAIAVNVWLLWDQVKDTPEVEGMRRRYVRATEKLWSPLRERQLFRRHTNAVIFEATQIVEDADA